jgi:hypothetical protein
MTNYELMQYKVLVLRIERNRRKIEELKSKEIPVISGKVKGSSKHFPYIESHFQVQMEEPKEADSCTKKIREIEEEISKDTAKIRRIEEFIKQIEDPELQVVFEMKVFDKMDWVEIATELNEDKDRTTYSKRYKKYIEDSHNSPSSH